ncbi:MAG: glycosyltransferase [Acidimicrobiia bacterium]|nr:glycosyltransferase [Acidimicrobiia bacterium]
MATAHLTSLATIAVAVNASDAAKVAAVLAATAVGEVSERFVVGGGSPSQAAAVAGSATWVRTTTELIAELPPSVTHVWLLHDDAMPRPDALRALVDAAEQIDAALVGSKVLRADDQSVLESVGGATDVFLVPDSGLAAGELDQEQYDVVRDVAFVPGESVLIRRDLLKGLGGPDRLLPPFTQAIDFAGRARSAGGRVAVVPSSEVLHAGTCHSEIPSWRDPAARWRAAAKLYSRWTAVWVLPMAILIALLDAVVRLVMLDVRPLLDLIKGLGWNAKHVVNTLTARRQARKIVQVDDGEMFRYQRSGSLVIARLGADLTDWLRERSTTLGVVARIDAERMFWQRPGFAYWVMALLAVVIGVRSLLLSGMPFAGYVLSPSTDPLSVLGAYAGGWNPIGFGTQGPGHPAAAGAALVQTVFSDSPMLVIIVSSLVGGLLGLRRLLRTLGIEGVAAVLGSLAGIACLAAWGSGSAGYWPTFPALAAAPWMVTSAVRPWPTGIRNRLGRLGGLMVSSCIVGLFVPLALGVGVAVSLLWMSFGTGSRVTIAIRAVVAAVGGLAVLGPWLWFSRLSDVVTGGQALPFSPPVWLAAGLALGTFLAVLAAAEPYTNVTGVGGLLALGGAVLLLVAQGREPSAAGLVLLAVGVTLVVGGVAGSLTGTRGLARAVLVLSQVAVVAAMVAAGLVIVTGRWGLPIDRYSEVIELTEARSADLPMGRVLLVGSDLPGDARELMGVPYKVMDGHLVVGDGWLPTYREADQALEQALLSASDPDVLRPGQAFGDLGIRWIVVTAPSVLDRAFTNKLDLKKLDVGDGRFTIYENVQPAFVAVIPDGLPWRLEGNRFVGEPAPQVALAVNPRPFGQSGVPVLADGSAGRIATTSDPAMRILGWVGAVALILAGVAAVVGFRERA